MFSQSMKKIESAVQESTFVAILEEEKKDGKKGDIQRRLLMMLGFQLALSGLLILVLVLGWPSVLRMRWPDTGMPPEQRLGEKEDLRSGVNNRITPEHESKDLTVDSPLKSIWMVTFDKIKLEAARMVKTKKIVEEKGIPKNHVDEKGWESGFQFGERGWMLPPSITR